MQGEQSKNLEKISVRGFLVSNLPSFCSVCKKSTLGDFPGGAVVKNPPANAGDTGSSPGPGRSHMPQSN